MGKTEWLKNLKPGDEVYYESNYNKGILKVKRLTKTEVIMFNKEGGEGNRYSLQTEKPVGASVWSTEMIYPLTEERIKELDTTFYIRKLIKFDWSKLSNEELHEIYLKIKGK